MVETYTVAYAVTNHLTKPEAARMNASKTYDRCPLYFFESYYGWSFYTGDLRESIEREEWPGLYAALEAVESTGARYLTLNADADPLEGVPTYDW